MHEVSIVRPKRGNESVASSIFHSRIQDGGKRGDEWRIRRRENRSFFRKKRFSPLRCLLYFLLYFSSFGDVFRFEKMKRLEKRGERRSRVIRLLAVGWGKEIIMEHRDDTSGTNVNRVRDCFRVRGARCTRENYGLSR